MSVFSFKRFDVINEKSAMKVNTDGVLLGALATIPATTTATDFAKTKNKLSVIDAGTGTGTIALMLAQRLEKQANVHILGVDIDKDSYLEAKQNFKNSLWHERIEAANISLQECEGQFDIIVSNPPYYDASLQNPDTKKNTARHTSTIDCEKQNNAPLSYRLLLDFASEHLSESGTLSIILPSDNEAALLRYSRYCGLYVFRIIRIRTIAGKMFSRIVVEFSRNRSDIMEEELTIHQNNSYTSEYQRLMHEFYLWA